MVDYIFWFEIAPFHMKTPFAERRMYHNLPFNVLSHHSFPYTGAGISRRILLMKIAQMKSEHIERKDKMRRPGLEPGFRRWQRLVITTTLSAQMCSEM
jgi:hypothetical protein